MSFRWIQRCVTAYIPELERLSAHHLTSFWTSKSASKVDASECEMIWDIIVDTPRAVSPLDAELMGITCEVVDVHMVNCVDI